MSDSSTEKKKGLGLLAWILIGCAGILVLGAILLTVAGIWGAKKVRQLADDLENNPTKVVELFVRANPDYELVETDEDAETVTIRQKESGEIFTLDFDEIRQGRFNIESAEGSFSIDASAAGSEGGSVKIETDKGTAVIGGDDGTMTIETDEGTSVFGQGDAKDIPDWVPMPDGKLSGVYRSETPEQRAGGVGIETGRGDLLEDYKAMLEREGFAIQQFTVAGDGGMIQATKDDGRYGVTLIAQGDGKGMIQFMEKVKP